MRTKSLLTAVCIFCSTYSFAEELFDVVVVGGGAAGNGRAGEKCNQPAALYAFGMPSGLE